ncbi:MAG: hypothetical protein EOO00_09470 [Chitinophagaceae bacterium]|nr:MAG: hypothetical protein EOO00_09470 [Chitinophagaceae bacterium]
MQLVQQTLNPAYVNFPKKASLISRFFDWCQTQEPNRYGWLAVIIAIHGCVLAPITVLVVAAGDNSMVLWAMAIGSMAMALVTNLAAMPTRITIPVFFLSVMIDFAIIGIALKSIIG